MSSLQHNQIEELADDMIDFIKKIKKRNEKLVGGIESISAHGKKNNEMALDIGFSYF